MSKRSGRKRRVAGWLLLVIGVLIAGVWGASRWWAFGYMGRHQGFSVREGVATAWDGASNFDSDYWYAESVAPRKWFDESRVSGVLMPPPDTLREFDAAVVSYREVAAQWGVVAPAGRDRILTIILWPIALASLLGGGWLVWSARRARRRAMTGVCLKCGYDLAGLAAGAPCPECGVNGRTPP